MSQYTENIHIAILGPVSAGKSTLLNALFSNTFSEMKRKKTTMLPQIYQISKDDNIVDSSENIFKKNKESNDEIIKLRESGQYKPEHFKELIYNISLIPDFITLDDKNATYSILDMPGLNCGGGDNMYFDYIKKISENIDLYILVFDINSGLNTTDEVKILQDINTEIVKNKHGSVHIIINKCDDITYNNNIEFKFNDDEITELYNTCEATVKKYLPNVNDYGCITISPLCSNELYVYRGAIYNIDTLDEKQIETIIKKEVGKKEFNKLKDKKKASDFLTGLINDKKLSLPNNWMIDTGYYLFKTCLNKHLTSDKYKKIIYKHIEMELIKLKSKGITDFDLVSNKLEEINIRIGNLTKSKKDIIPDYINTNLQHIMNMLDQYLIMGINSYSASTVEISNTFIGKIGNLFYKIKNIFLSNPLEKSEKQIKEKRILLLNNDLSIIYIEEIFRELYVNNQIDFNKYCKGIKTTINLKKIDIDILLKSVSIITNNKIEYINFIINEFISTYKYEDLSKFCNNILIKISNICNNNFEIMSKLIRCHFSELQHEDSWIIYIDWIDNNSYNILNETDEIQYLYYIIRALLSDKNSYKKSYKESITLVSFKSYKKDMDELFSILCKLIGKKDSIKEDLINKDSNKVIKKIIKNTLVEEDSSSDDNFHEVSNDNSENSGSENSGSENSEDYNSNDDSDIVYKKAIKNVKIRTTQRTNIGSRINKINKIDK